MGGDGDQACLAGRPVAETVEGAWFSGMTPRARALLVRLTIGPHAGAYLALTSRIVDDLSEQIDRGDYLDAVVHAVRNPGPGFDASMENLPAAGRALLNIIER